MKYLIAFFAFVGTFLAVGALMHHSLYEKPGIFVWSLQTEEGEEGRKLRRTTLEPLSVEVELAGQSAARAEETASAAQEKAGESVTPGEGGEGKPQDAEQKKEEVSKDTISLFNGKDLGEWKKTQFGGEGDVEVNEDGFLEFGFGAVMTGVHWGGKVPATSNYEISLEAMKLDGHDFFCALTFPVKDSHATLVVGGWGGGIVGISCVDDLNASENETMNIEGFEDKRWYKIRLVVTDERLEAWIDQRKMVDLPLEGRKISLLPGDIESSVPLGIASYQTRSQYRNVVWKNLPAAK